jgi:PKD repeat protein
LFSCLFSNYALAESVSITISGPGKCLVNEELSYSVNIKEEWIIESADWEFGDGTSSERTSVSHKFSNAGEFSVKVTVDAYKKVINDEGSTEKKTGSGSATKKVTCMGKIVGGIDPNSLPADGESTCSLVIYVVDYTGRDVITSYNRSVKVSSSDSEILSVPDKVKLKSGAEEIECTIGMKEGTAKIKVSGSYLEGNSFKITAENNAAKLASVKAVDLKDRSRFSESKLQMVGKTYASRNARVYAYKDEESRKWQEGEPIWTGIKNDNGVDKIDVSVRKTNKQTASAGGISKSVILEIVDNKEYEVNIGLVVGEFKSILDKMASTMCGDSTAIKADVKGGCKWYKVDQRKSPLCQNTYELSGSGGIGYSQKFYVPSLSFDLKFLKIGVFLEPDISLRVTGLSIVKDGSLPPEMRGASRFTKKNGKATLSGKLSAGTGAEVRLSPKVLTATATLEGAVGATGSLEVNSGDPTKIIGSYEIGILEVSGNVFILYKNKETFSKTITKIIGDENGFMNGDKTIDLSNYFNKE